MYAMCSCVALCVLQGKKSSQLVDVLNAILPPREYLDEHGRRLAQAVSSAPSSRDQVITLQMKLDERLQERQARENGICPVREELYSQCFDELIRQVTIESPERGLLLMRVRDEVRMTISAYQTLYQSSITFGMRKTLQAEQGNSELIKRVRRRHTRIITYGGTHQPSHVSDMDG
jgi:dynein light intermediate chain